MRSTYTKCHVYEYRVCARCVIYAYMSKIYQSLIFSLFIQKNIDCSACDCVCRNNNKK